MELFATIHDMYVGLGDIVLVNSDGELDEQLDLPESKIADMKRDLHSLSQRREAYLDLYATDHPIPTWSQVAETLRWCGLPSQADMVENTYVHGM
ncbi:MAG: hypothetical protein MJE68_00765 [Proteobacteria bacterium]|nr:hypothetical protein [Pseudomonadota bacterium]